MNADRKGEKHKKSQIVHPYQSREATTTTAPNEPVPYLPDGRTTVDIELNIPADRAYQLFFTDNEFYRNWLFVSCHVFQ